MFEHPIFTKNFSPDSICKQKLEEDEFNSEEGCDHDYITVGMWDGEGDGGDSLTESIKGHY